VAYVCHEGEPAFFIGVDPFFGGGCALMGLNAKNMRKKVNNMQFCEVRVETDAENGRVLFPKSSKPTECC